MNQTRKWRTEAVRQCALRVYKLDRDCISRDKTKSWQQCINEACKILGVDRASIDRVSKGKYRSWEIMS